MQHSTQRLPWHRQYRTPDLPPLAPPVGSSQDPGLQCHMISSISPFCQRYASQLGDQRRALAFAAEDLGRRPGTCALAQITSGIQSPFFRRTSSAGPACTGRPRGSRDNSRMPASRRLGSPGPKAETAASPAENRRPPRDRPALIGGTVGHPARAPAEPARRARFMSNVVSPCSP